jgi:hypothetical protein
MIGIKGKCTTGDICNGGITYIPNNQLRTIHTMKLRNNECAQIGGRERIPGEHCASGHCRVNPTSTLAMPNLRWYRLSRNQGIHTSWASQSRSELWSEFVFIQDVPPPPPVTQSCQCGAIQSPLHCYNIWEANGDAVRRFCTWEHMKAGGSFYHESSIFPGKMF